MRRAGFGLSAAEREQFAHYTYPMAVAALTEFNPAETNVDDKIDQSGYVIVRGANPNTVINDARQRWLFRMIHSPAPLQERMALIWHHHFATAYSKISGLVGGPEATRMMAAKPSEDRRGMKGQIELFREYALGNFRDLLVEVAKDPAMLYWLDGYLNRRAQPQENFGRELMELFTFGVEHYTEQDVYAAARVFTGWNLARHQRRNATTRSSSSPTSPRSTTRTPRTSRSRSTRTAAGASRRERPRAACRTGSI